VQRLGHGDPKVQVFRFAIRKLPSGLDLEPYAVSEKH
jgi:hypothetical protein